MQIILYTTLGCHLCEQAKAQLYPVLEGRNAAIEEVDIADSEILMDRYGIRIPVVQCDGAELDWPFTSADFAELLASRNG